jgi:hypothetical protein
VTFEERAAGADDLALDEALGPVAAGLEPEALVEVEEAGAGIDHLGHEPGEQALDGPGAAGEDGVGVAALGYALARVEPGGQIVAIEHGHGGGVIGQDAGGSEAGHAGADHDGVANGGSRHPSHSFEQVRLISRVRPPERRRFATDTDCGCVIRLAAPCNAAG